jgi:hypothetical protein
MNILLLAPQPFYAERGTCIAVNSLLKVLSERGETVDVITYPEGKDVQHHFVSLHRIRHIPFVYNVRPGFSCKKIVCDVAMVFKAIRLVSRKRYDLIHAVEESVFIALAIKWLFGLPYVYDMDSSLVGQMIEQYPLLAPLKPIFKRFESLAVRNAKVVVAVCEALADSIEGYGPERVIILRDVSLLSNNDQPAE